MYDRQVVEEGSEGYETLRGVVKKTKVVVTCAGPFEKYGQALVRLCVEEGVSLCTCLQKERGRDVLVVMLESAAVY